MICRPVAVMEDGWSEWIHPSPGFLMECCDCGLVHELHVRIGKDNGEGTPLNEGERRNGRAVIFRMRRAVTSQALPTPMSVKRTIAAGRILDVMTGGKFDWRDRLEDSDFLESADWLTALAYADAALSTPATSA